MPADNKRVRVGYRDGSYWLEEYTADHAKAGLGYVELSYQAWRCYQGHVQEDRAWHEWLRVLDNEQWAKDHPEDKPS